MDRINRPGRQQLDEWFLDLKDLEHELLDPATRGNAGRLNELIRDDFVEYGSSGRIYHKKLLIDMMLHEEHADVLIRNLEIKALSVNVALVTYKTIGQAGNEARRSSVWVNSLGQWQIVFHQGTRIDVAKYNRFG